ncbi:MAG TPA: twin-arginine translocase TatA/TatE family subunit [Fimbriimonadaceae bacterium]|nr:twin-arginine translocase TatA/TatE family subunit [Fimbriimonadaceae bacterium]
MGLLEPMHLVLIALAILVFFGPKKIPELMRGIGKGMGELQKAINEGKTALNSAMHEIDHSTTPADTPIPDKVVEANPEYHMAETAAPEPEAAAPKPKAVPKTDKPARTTRSAKPAKSA